MTLTQTEKGYPQPVTHVGIPKSIRDEKGWHWAPTHTAPVHYPWHKAPYLEKRKKELEKYITELDPKKPVCIFVQVTPMIAMIYLSQRNTKIYKVVEKWYDIKLKLKLHLYVIA